MCARRKFDCDELAGRCVARRTFSPCEVQDVLPIGCGQRAICGTVGADGALRLLCPKNSWLPTQQGCPRSNAPERIPHNVLPTAAASQLACCLQSSRCVPRRLARAASSTVDLCRNSQSFLSNFCRWHTIPLRARGTRRRKTTDSRDVAVGSDSRLIDGRSVHP